MILCAPPIDNVFLSTNCAFAVTTIADSNSAAPKLLYMVFIVSSFSGSALIRVNPRLIFRCDRDSQHVRSVWVSESVFDWSDFLSFGHAGICTFLSWRLVGTDSRLFVDFGTRIPQSDLRDHVAAHRLAVLIEQVDAVFVTKKQVV